MATPDDLSALYADRRVQSVITSYGQHHQDPPDGDALLVDTAPLRNPPTADLLHATGLDPRVRRYVMATPGARRLVARTAEKVRILLEPDTLRQWAGPQLYRVDVHVRCQYGRHRSVVVAEEVAVHLRAAGIGVQVEHRHIDRPY